MALSVFLHLLNGVLPPVAHPAHELHHVVVRFPIDISPIALMMELQVITHDFPEKCLVIYITMGKDFEI